MEYCTAAKQLILLIGTKGTNNLELAIEEEGEATNNKVMADLEPATHP